MAPPRRATETRGEAGRGGIISHPPGRLLYKGSQRSTAQWGSHSQVTPCLCPTYFCFLIKISFFTIVRGTKTCLLTYLTLGVFQIKMTC